MLVNSHGTTTADIGRKRSLTISACITPLCAGCVLIYCEAIMTKFRSPVRRKTRQRSGFSVSGLGTGSTCKIEDTVLLHPTSDELEIVIQDRKLLLQNLFKRQLGILGGGIYLRPEGKCIAQAILSWKERGDTKKEEKNTFKFKEMMWARMGLVSKVKVTNKQETISDVILTLRLKTNKPVSIYGPMLGALNNDYFIETDVSEEFDKQTLMYIPEILYLDLAKNTMPYKVVIGHVTSSGHQIVTKSCNRCSRFLPINIEDDRQHLGFSNHCVSRAPCSHSAFSSYTIESGVPKQYLTKYTNDGKIVSYRGHQLECRCCKKFFVNAPLNPMRDSTQHREDSLRRRAFEVLVNELLGRKWIYFKYRLSKGKEFDVYIWDKFDRRCFNCEDPLNNPSDMHLDHTMPLSYLWPLDDTATCLCQTCNSEKHNRFPVDFYKRDKLIKLSEITSLPMDMLSSRIINHKAVEALKKKIEWFFDGFLSAEDYQKIRKGKKAADLILKSLHDVLHSSDYEIDLVDLYRKETGRRPITVSSES